MLNKIFIQGRFTKAPELRKTQNGKSVCSFTIACDRDFDRSKADFVNCTAWNQTAEFIHKHFDKGQMVIVVGSLQSREWEKDGNKHTAWEVQVEQAQFCGSKKASADIAATEFEELADDEQLPF